MPRIVAVSLVLISLAACGQATPPDKEELSRRLNSSRALTPEKRVAIYCGARVSNLCDKLRAEPGYRDSWLTAMDRMADAKAATDRAITNLEEMRAENQRKLDDYVASTAKLPDGRPVFVDKNGTYWDDKGNVIPPEVARTAR